MASGKSPAPAGPRHTGPWNEFADATGIDAKYAQEQAEADRQLAEAMAGPGDENEAGYAAEPEDEADAPLRKMMRDGLHFEPGPDGQSNRKPDGSTDPEGQQGSATKSGARQV